MIRRRKDRSARTSKWKRLRRWSLIVFIMMAVGMLASIEITSRSSFCNSCHIMGPYYESWTSDPHSDVGCVNCHIPPGATSYVSAKLNGLGQVVDDWLNRTSTKPSAAVSDFTCTREGCHVMNEVDTSDDTERRYFFDHEQHQGLEYRGIAVHCTTCHSHIKEGELHFEVNTNACIACHFIQPSPAATQNTVVAGVSRKMEESPETIQHDGRGIARMVLRHEPDETKAPRGCESCHQPPQEPFKHDGLIVDHLEYLDHGASCESCHRGVTTIPQPVGDTQCLNCHVFGREKVTTAADMHRVHTEGEHKVECFNCHGVIRHGSEAQIMSLNQFDCRSCHTDQHQIQRNTYLNGNGNGNGNSDYGQTHAEDELLISPMFLAHVDCTGCHIQPDAVSVNPDSGAMVAKAIAAACDECHESGFGDKMIPMWQKATREMYDSVASLLPSDENPWLGENASAARLVRNARKRIDLVRIDKSWGVHNPRYTQMLLEQAREELIKARRIVNPEPGESP